MGVPSVVLYSGIYGPGYDKPKDVSSVDVPCIMYTDDPNLEAPGWEVRHTLFPNISTPMLQAKYVKCMSHLYAVEGDVSIWIDASVSPYPDMVPKMLAAAGDLDVALTPHPWRKCIYDEYEASAGLPKYDADMMLDQVQTYRDMGHPEKWGLYASGIMLRRLNDRVRAFNTAWWIENKYRSWQDQLSLPHVLRTSHDLRYQAVLPWAEWWGISPHGI